MRNPGRQRFLIWAGLACVLLVFVVLVVRIHPTNFFGLTEDDSIYFTSAKALAQGQGYTVPSVPGKPAATKYPILYPWMLSCVWRWNPSFPSNLRVAIGMSAAFGAIFLCLAFCFVRELKGFSDAEALIVTLICGMEPLFVLYSGSVLTEVPFAAFTLGALYLADEAMRPGGGSKPLFCGALVGTASFIRVLGVPVAAGILCCGLVRKQYRACALFCASFLPFMCLLAWRIVFPAHLMQPVAASFRSNPAWQREWAYYTSYIADWRNDVPNLHIFWLMLKNHAIALMLGPSEFFVSLFTERGKQVSLTLAVIITAAVITGVIRQARQSEWKPIHFALPFYMGTIVLWSYLDATRFLVPFLPLFAAGLWFEGKFALRLAGKAAASGSAGGEKMAAATIALGVLFVAGGIGWHYYSAMKSIRAKSFERAAFLESKKDAYEWLATQTGPGTRVIAYEDALLYLYTGRTAMRPTTFVIADFLEAPRMNKVMAEMGDVAPAIGAACWLVSDDDFSMESRTVTLPARAREKEIQLPSALAYRSPDGRVGVFCQRGLQPAYGSWGGR